MFSKDSKTTTTPPPAPAPTPPPAEPTRTATRSAAPSIISPDLKIKGDLVCNGDIQIDGSVEGDVVSRTITVGEGADIRGAISAESVRVCGAVNGQVKGNTVTLAKTAKVIGDIMHQTLSIEPGAFFEGQCRRIDSSQISDARVSQLKQPASGGSQSAAASQANAR
jgi:cytoskeletal protein CcmA (bactofilin family)